jgi:hypothetical protein
MKLTIRISCTTGAEILSALFKALQRGAMRGDNLGVSDAVRFHELVNFRANAISNGAFLGGNRLALWFIVHVCNECIYQSGAFCGVTDGEPIKGVIEGCFHFYFFGG